MSYFSIDRTQFKTLNEFVHTIENQLSCPVYGGFNEISSNEIGVFPEARRIIALGDIHGDFEVLAEALLKAELIDRNQRWTGGDTILIQVGDLLDRGGRQNSIDTITDNEELDIIQFLDYLNKEARAENGAVITLIGNHEIMNLLGDFRYTSENTLADFGGIEKRKELFAPGGAISKHLSCSCYGIVKIGDWIFVHAGITPNHLEKFSIPEINTLVKSILANTKDINSLSQEEKALIFDNNGILWTRELHEQGKCSSVVECLNILNNNTNGGIVVGHTIQENINSICNKKLWRIDTGPSNAFGPVRNIQVLEILNNGKNINIIK